MARPRRRPVGTKKERKAIYRMARDCWVEVLRCPDCGKMGEAELFQMKSALTSAPLTASLTRE
jgi:hypothetical protein